MIASELKALLDLFEGYMPDKETNRLVQAICSDREKWINAHELFTSIRKRYLKTIKEQNVLKECQYSFEEVCAKTLFNMTSPNAPFDPDSPYWVIKNALRLAQEAGIDISEVVNIVAPNPAFKRDALKRAP